MPSRIVAEELQGYARSWELFRTAKTVCAREKQVGVIAQEDQDNADDETPEHHKQQQPAGAILAEDTLTDAEKEQSLLQLKSPSRKQLDALSRRVDTGLGRTGLSSMFKLQLTSTADDHEAAVKAQKQAEADERRHARVSGGITSKVKQLIEETAKALDVNDVRLEEVRLPSLAINDLGLKTLIRSMRSNQPMVCCFCYCYHY